MNFQRILLIALTSIIIGQRTVHSSKTVTLKYVIGSMSAGLGACLHATLNHLYYCNKIHQTPVVYWSTESLYYDKNGFNGRQNVWEYYFKPTSHLVYKPTDRVTYSFDVHNTNNFHYSLISQKKRDEAKALIDKYIKINDPIVKKIDSFYQQNMAGKQTIGIHIRGTDKFSEEKLIKPEQMVAEALKYADNNTQFLVASDEQKLLDRIIELLPQNKSIYYDCYRSDDGTPIHIHRKPSFAQLGEDILVKMSLLAKCDLLVHTASNVSSVALYFNPRLHNILVR